MGEEERARSAHRSREVRDFIRFRILCASWRFDESIASRAFTFRSLDGWMDVRIDRRCTLQLFPIENFINGSKCYKFTLTAGNFAEAVALAL